MYHEKNNSDISGRCRRPPAADSGMGVKKKAREASLALRNIPSAALQPVTRSS